LLKVLFKPYYEYFTTQKKKKMKFLYLLLLLIPNFSFGQIDSFCAEKFKLGKEAGDSLINAEIDYMVWDDWNIIEGGIGKWLLFLTVCKYSKLS
jgi:hypothetical protein